MRTIVTAALALAAGCGQWSSPRKVRRTSIAWPLEAEVVRVERLPAEVRADPIEGPPPAFIALAGCAVVAYDAGAKTPTSHLPPAFAAIMPGGPACWLDGVFVAWDHEVCVLGGHVDVDGANIPVDGGFCYAPDTQRWRAVHLAFMPDRFGDSSAVDTYCRPVRVDGARALHCSMRSGGQTTSPPGASFVEHVPETYWEEMLRFDGLR